MVDEPTPSVDKIPNLVSRTRGKVFRDAIHGLIRIEDEDWFLLDLINTPEFQRLRRIRQLGVSSFTYPGAEHSRFTHSLGVLNFAQRIIETLEHRHRSDAQAVEMLKSRHKEIKAAALLHDVGHGPFSHMIERAFPATADHERVTIQLITESPSTIPDILTQHQIDSKAVRDIIAKATPERLLVDIVSSQLDADRMDYILRDALLTGVKYGVFDSDWLIASLCIGTEPNQGTSADPKKWRLCIDSKRGLHSAEQLIVARMHMSLQVYFHRVTRQWEVHLLCLLKLASNLAMNDVLPGGTPIVVREFLKYEGNVNHETFLLSDEASFVSAFQVWSRATGDKHKRIAALANGFLNRQPSFRCIELSELSVVESMTLTTELQKLGQPNVDWSLDAINFSSYKDFGTTLRRAQSNKASSSTTAILMTDGSLGGASVPVEDSSLMFKAMGNTPSVQLNRLYCDHGIEPEVRKMLKRLHLVRS